jgi:Domain of unknown function (DUF4844)
VIFKKLFQLLLVAIGLVWITLFAVTRFPSEQKLVVTPSTIAALTALRAEQKFTDLPGYSIGKEQQRNSTTINNFLDRLIASVEQHPSKKWVLNELEIAVEQFHLEDTEARERCIVYVEKTLQILKIQSVDRYFYKYFIFI